VTADAATEVRQESRKGGTFEKLLRLDVGDIADREGIESHPDPEEFKDIFETL
jgi:hypothetical protein